MRFASIAAQNYPIVRYNNNVYGVQKYILNTIAGIRSSQFNQVNRSQFSLFRASECTCAQCRFPIVCVSTQYIHLYLCGLCPGFIICAVYARGLSVYTVVVFLEDSLRLQYFQNTMVTQNTISTYNTVKQNSSLRGSANVFTDISFKRTLHGDHLGISLAF